MDFNRILTAGTWHELTFFLALIILTSIIQLGDVAEGLGKALQKLLRGFKSLRHLQIISALRDKPK